MVTAIRHLVLPRAQSIGADHGIEPFQRERHPEMRRAVLPPDHLNKYGSRFRDGWAGESLRAPNQSRSKRDFGTALCERKLLASSIPLLAFVVAAT
jgi:hypothetical protein